MGANLAGWHLIIILGIIVLLFGAPKLPALARSMGESMRIFKKEVRVARAEDSSPSVGAPTIDVSESKPSVAETVTVDRTHP